MDDDGNVDASTGKNKYIITVTAIVTKEEGNEKKELKKVKKVTMTKKIKLSKSNS